MKKLSKVLALVLAMSMICIIFASCGKTISGTYQLDATGSIGGALKSGIVTTFKFSGSKVTKTVETYVAGAVTSTDTETGTYEITEAASGTLQISFTWGESEPTSPVVFEEKDGSIVIGILTYKAVD